MRGRQLEMSHKKKQKLQSVGFTEIGYIQGKAHEILKTSPRERHRQSKIYLKTLTQISNPGLKTTGTQSDSLVHIEIENPNSIINTFHIPLILADKSDQKQIKFESFSKFALRCQTSKNSDFTALKYELFPPELNEDIKYLPDYSPSKICDQIALITDSKTSRSKDTKLKTITKTGKPRHQSPSINLSTLLKNKFPTYYTGRKDRIELQTFRVSRLKKKKFLKL